VSVALGRAAESPVAVVAAVRAEEVSVHGPAGEIVGRLSFSVEVGQTLGIVGESGSGKSLTARAICGLLPPGLRAGGVVHFAGTSVTLPGTAGEWQALRGTGVALVLQDPFTSLSPAHRCGEQVAWSLRRRLDGRAFQQGRAGRAELSEQVNGYLGEVNLPPDVARRYPGELSGGMRQRVAVAAALAAGPLLMIADEPTTALDASTRRDLLELLARLQRQHGMALVLISHDVAMVRGVADDVIVMYAGRMVETGPARQVLDRPSHPYTVALKVSDPPLGRRLERLIALPGRVPPPGRRPPGCVFAERCQLARAECSVREPELAPVPGGAEVACLVSEGPLALPEAREIVDPPVAGTGVPAALEARDLFKSFGSHLVLKGVTLEVRRGGCTGLVGGSGSGKTTLARCVAGLEHPDRGVISFGGQPVTRRSAGQVQLVFQDPYSALNPKMRVGTALSEAARARRAGGATSPEELLDLVGLSAAFASKYPRDLSGGERQRVAIARSLAPAPELLICDEPVSALDVSVQAQVLNLLSDLRERLGLSVLFISHDLAVVRQVSDVVYVLHHGQVVEFGPTAEVLQSPSADYTRRLVRAVSPPEAGH
jgi:peptide/nickel transport system ATP-binding protein